MNVRKLTGRLAKKALSGAVALTMAASLVSFSGFTALADDIPVTPPVPPDIPNTQDTITGNYSINFGDVDRGTWLQGMYDGIDWGTMDTTPGASNWHTFGSATAYQWVAQGNGNLCTLNDNSAWNAGATDAERTITLPDGTLLKSIRYCLSGDTTYGGGGFWIKVSSPGSGNPDVTFTTVTSDKSMATEFTTGWKYPSKEVTFTVHCTGDGRVAGVYFGQMTYGIPDDVNANFRDTLPNEAVGSGGTTILSGMYQGIDWGAANVADDNNPLVTNWTVYNSSTYIWDAQGYGRLMGLNEQPSQGWGKGPTDATGSFTLPTGTTLKSYKFCTAGESNYGGNFYITVSSPGSGNPDVTVTAANGDSSMANTIETHWLYPSKQVTVHVHCAADGMIDAVYFGQFTYGTPEDVAVTFDTGNATLSGTNYGGINWGGTSPATDVQPYSAVWRTGGSANNQYNNTFRLTINDSQDIWSGVGNVTATQTLQVPAGTVLKSFKFYMVSDAPNGFYILLQSPGNPDFTTTTVLRDASVPLDVETGWMYPSSEVTMTVYANTGGGGGMVGGVYFCEFTYGSPFMGTHVQPPTLSSLSVAATATSAVSSLTPTFDPNTTMYVCVVPNAVNSAIITATDDNETDVMTGDAGVAHDLKVGSNVYYVTLSNADTGLSTTYQVNVARMAAGASGAPAGSLQELTFQQEAMFGDGPDDRGVMQNSVTTDKDGYIYMVYAGAQQPTDRSDSVNYYPDDLGRHLMIAKIDPADGSYTLTDVMGVAMYVDNFHRAPTVAIDTDGYIHVIGNQRGRSGDSWMFYYVSDKPYDISSFTQRTVVGDGVALNVPSADNYITYPCFWTDRIGTLYITWYKLVYDSPEMGAAGLAKYNPATQSWTEIGGKNYPDNAADNPIKAGYRQCFIYNRLDYAGSYCAVCIQLFFDKDNVMHMAAPVNRTFVDSMAGYPCTSVLYASSPDGGATWYKADGSQIMTLPITETNGDVAVGTDITLAEGNNGLPPTKGPLSATGLAYGIYTGGCCIGMDIEGQPIISFTRFCQVNPINGGINQTCAFLTKWDPATSSWTTPLPSSVLATTTPLFYTDDNGVMTAGDGRTTLYRSFDDGVTWQTYNLASLGGYAGGTIRLDWAYAYKTGNFRYQVYRDNGTASMTYSDGTTGAAPTTDQPFGTPGTGSGVHFTAVYTASFSGSAEQKSDTPIPVTYEKDVDTANALNGTTYIDDAINSSTPDNINSGYAKKFIIDYMTDGSQFDKAAWFVPGMVATLYYSAPGVNNDILGNAGIRFGTLLAGSTLTTPYQDQNGWSPIGLSGSVTDQNTLGICDPNKNVVQLTYNAIENSNPNFSYIAIWNRGTWIVNPLIVDRVTIGWAGEGLPPWQSAEITYKNNFSATDTSVYTTQTAANWAETTDPSIVGYYTLTAPDKPSRSGYVFGGWFTDAACTTPFDFTTGQVTTDKLSLFAKWTAIASTLIPVTYEYDVDMTSPANGMANMTSDIATDYAQKFMAAVMSDGAAFDKAAWYVPGLVATVYFDKTLASGQNEQDFINNYGIRLATLNAGSTLTNNNGYTPISFTTDVSQQNSVEIFDPVNSALQLTYNAIQATNPNFSYIATWMRGTWLTPTFTVNRMTLGWGGEGLPPWQTAEITYMSDDSVYATQTATNWAETTDPLIVGYYTLTAPDDPYMEGYTFGGWFTDADCATAWDFANDQLTTDTLTLYALWTPNGGGEPTVPTVNVGGVVDLPIVETAGNNASVTISDEQLTTILTSVSGDITIDLSSYDSADVTLLASMLKGVDVNLIIITKDGSFSFKTKSLFNASGKTVTASVTNGKSSFKNGN